MLAMRVDMAAAVPVCVGVRCVCVVVVRGVEVVDPV